MIRTAWRALVALSAPWHSTGVGQASALTLTIAAAAWTMIGVGVATGAADQPEASPHAHLPMTLRLALWWIPALTCVLTLLTRRYAAAACGLLILAPMVRICSYLWMWVMELITPDVDPGVGWYVASIHAPLIGLVGLAALLTRICREEGIIR